MMDYFISWLFEGSFHVDKMHMWFKIANIVHALPVLVLWQTDFTPKRVLVSCLHETIARFRTAVKFLLWYNNSGELTQGWLAPGWYFVVVSCKQMQSHEREPEWTRSRAKVVSEYHVNTPCVQIYFLLLSFIVKSLIIFSSHFSLLRWWKDIYRHCVVSVVYRRLGFEGEAGLSIFVAVVNCVDIHPPFLLFSVYYRLLVNFNPQ